MNTDSDTTKRIPTWVYKFPNGMVATCDQYGEQIPELQGPFSRELIKQILERSTIFTKWNGIPMRLLDELGHEILKEYT